MTKTALRIVGTGCSPVCADCNPTAAEHPYMRGEVMTKVPRQAVRVVLDGNVTQLCLPCFQARFPDADLAPIRKKIASDPLFTMGIVSTDIEI